MSDIQSQIIDQTAGNSVTFSFSACASQVTANQGFRIPIILPFITKNTNYTISATLNKIAGVANTPETTTTAYDKGNNSFTLFMYTGKTTNIITSIGDGTITLTFA